MANLKSLTKIELEELGREHGIELDRRLTKDTLIAQLQEVLGEPEEPTTLIDLKSEVIEKAPVLKEVESETVSGELLTERTKPKKRVNKLFADENGDILKFATKSSARASGHKYDGKVIAKDGYFVVKGY